MAGILNRYGEVYQEINDYYCNEPPEIKECDPFQVFLVNQNHLSNCFLLLSDHLNDNVRKVLFYLFWIFKCKILLPKSVKDWIKMLKGN